jgi:hypothetical protein
MRYIYLLLAVAATIGCEEARGPLIAMDGQAVAAVKRVAILPVANITPYTEVNPLVERVFTTELTSLQRFEFISQKEVAKALDSLKLTEEDLGNPLNVKTLGEYLHADGVIGVGITAYSPFGTEAALLGKETEAAKKEIKPPRGILGWLVPTEVSVSHTEYQYGTVTREPAIGATVAMVNVADARVIYEASKLIQRDTRVPGGYNLNYGGVLTSDELRRVDFIARLAVKEMLDPLRRER